MSKDSKWIDLPLIQTISENMPVSTYSVAYTPTSATFLPFRLNSAHISRIVNMIPWKLDDQRIALRWREGITETSTGFGGKGGAVTVPRGTFWLASIGRIAEIWDTTIYVQLVSSNYTTTTSVGATTEGPGGACDGIDSTGTAFGFVSTKSKSVIVVETNAVQTAVSDGDFPSAVVPMPVFLDGYVFIAKDDSRSIYNSDPGDPTSWQASTYINTEETGGKIMGLVRHHRHVVALCEDHCEFFLDAAIPSPNSPLQRDPQYMQRIGLINRATVATYGDITVFAGVDAAGRFGIYKLEDYKLEKISTPTIDAYIQQVAAPSGVARSVQTWTHGSFATGFFMPQYGSRVCYCLNIDGGKAVSGTDILTAKPCFMYDPDFKIWTEIANYKYKSTNSAATQYMWGGFGVSYACTPRSKLKLGTSYSWLGQGAFGGTGGGTEMLQTGSYRAEVQDVSGIQYASDATNVWNLEGPTAVIEWPPTDFDTPSLKSIDGVYIGHTTSYDAIYFPWKDGRKLPCSFGHSGYMMQQEMVSNFGNELPTMWNSYSIPGYLTIPSDTSITPDPSIIVRPRGGSFRMNSMWLILPDKGWIGYEVGGQGYGRFITGVKVRVTPHEDI